MREQLTKETNLADLKQAIERVPANPRFVCGDVEFDDLYRYEFQRAEAWRTAFEWRDYFGGNVNRSCGCKSCREDCAEYDEGLRLIREKLS